MILNTFKNNKLCQILLIIGILCLIGIKIYALAPKSPAQRIYPAILPYLQKESAAVFQLDLKGLINSGLLDRDMPLHDLTVVIPTHEEMDGLGDVGAACWFARRLADYPGCDIEILMQDNDNSRLFFPDLNQVGGQLSPISIVIYDRVDGLGLKLVDSAVRFYSDYFIDREGFVPEARPANIYIAVTEPGFISKQARIFIEKEQDDIYFSVIVSPGFPDYGLGVYLDPRSLRYSQQFKEATSNEILDWKGQLLAEIGFTGGPDIVTALTKSEWTLAYTYHSANTLRYISILEEARAHLPSSKKATIFVPNRMYSIWFADGLVHSGYQQRGFGRSSVFFKGNIQVVVTDSRFPENEFVQFIALSTLPLILTGDVSVFQAISAGKPFFCEQRGHKEGMIEQLLQYAAKRQVRLPHKLFWPFQVGTARFEAKHLKVSAEELIRHKMDDLRFNAEKLSQACWQDSDLFRRLANLQLLLEELRLWLKSNPELLPRIGDPEFATELDRSALAPKAAGNYAPAVISIYFEGESHTMDLILKRCLENTPYELLEKSDWPDIDTKNPGIAILGTDVAKNKIRALKALFPGIKIIIVAGVLLSDEDIEDMGADYCVMQYYDKETLTGAVEQAVADSSMPPPRAIYPEVTGGSFPYQPVSLRNAPLIRESMGLVRSYEYYHRLVRNGKGEYFLIKSASKLDYWQKKAFMYSIKNDPVREYVAFRIARALGANVCDVIIPSLEEKAALAQYTGLRPEDIYLVRVSTSYNLNDPEVLNTDWNKAFTRNFVTAVLMRKIDFHDGNHRPIADSDIPMMFDNDQVFSPEMSSMSDFIKHFTANFFKGLGRGRGSGEVNLLLKRIDLDELTLAVRECAGTDLDTLEAELRAELPDYEEMIGRYFDYVKASQVTLVHDIEFLLSFYIKYPNTAFMQSTQNPCISLTELWAALELDPVTLEPKTCQDIATSSLAPKAAVGRVEEWSLVEQRLGRVIAALREASLLKGVHNPQDLIEAFRESWDSGYLPYCRKSIDLLSTGLEAVFCYRYLYPVRLYKNDGNTSCGVITLQLEDGRHRLIMRADLQARKPLLTVLLHYKGKPIGIVRIGCDRSKRGSIPHLDIEAPAKLGSQPWVAHRWLNDVFPDQAAMRDFLNFLFERIEASATSIIIEPSSRQREALRSGLAVRAAAERLKYLNNF